MAIDPIPSDYPRVCPYLIVDGASDAIKFYATILGTTERMRLPGPGGLIGHAELQLGGSIIMLADAYPDMGIRGPKDIGGSPVTMTVYVDDVDATIRRSPRCWRHVDSAGRGQVLSGRTVRRPLRSSVERDEPHRGSHP